MLAEGLWVVSRRGDDDRVDEYAGDLHRLRREEPVGRDPLDLGKNDAAGVPHRLGDGQHLHGERLTLHRDVAFLVRGRAPDQADVDRERREVQVLLGVDLEHPHQVIPRAAVHLAALEPRVDERPESHLGDRARLVRGDVAEQVGDHAERKAVRLDAVLDREPAQRRSEPPVPADRPAHHALAGEVVQAAGRPVALTGAEDEREVPRAARPGEAGLEGDRELLRHTNADEAADRDRVAV